MAPIYIIREYRWRDGETRYYASRSAPARAVELKTDGDETYSLDAMITITNAASIPALRAALDEAERIAREEAQS